MKLSRIRLEQFKQFRKPIEIKDLDDGINLFIGPNEAGKSTIVAAVRAAFFERHRSSSVDELRPWGDSSASPTVELEFSIAGKPYRLAKSFLSKKRCELVVGTQRLDGALAEDHLAELLGFQYAGKGASAAQHWGIPGLLWIQQGAGQEIRDAVSNAAGHLRTALNDSLGEVASSGGDEVLATVQASRNEMLTPAGGTPRGVYGDVLKQEAELEGKLKSIDADIVAYRQKVDSLAELRREHAVDETEKPWIAFRLQEHQARAKFDGIERVQESLAADRKRAEQLDIQITLIRGQVEAFAKQEVAARTRATDLETAQGALVTANGMVEQWASSPSMRITQVRRNSGRQSSHQRLRGSYRSWDQRRTSFPSSEKKRACGYANPTAAIRSHAQTSCRTHSFPMPFSLQVMLIRSPR